ncbi:MAG TPA: FkbM family methyltransferase [Roseiflexaceae bacterium]|nr:FkbM family methyltransferase [Roseiflexaceae bacterium]
MRARKFLYYLASLRTLLSQVRNWPVPFWDLLGLPIGRPYLLRLRDGAVFQIRNFMDAWIVKEVYLDGDYERYGVALQPNWTVIDIGACLGSFAVFAARHAPGIRVHAFEPAPDSFRLLRQNLELNRVANVSIYPSAVAAASGPLTLYTFAGHAEQNSLNPLRAHADARAVTVEALALADVFDRLAIDHCDFLKIDCEGAEFDMLLNAPPELFKRVSHICMEYHDGVTPFTHADLLRHFERMGLRARRFPSPVLPNEGFIYAYRPATQ